MQISPISNLEETIEEFLDICRIDGKSPATVTAYQQSLYRFLPHARLQQEPSSRKSILAYLSAMQGLARESRHRYFRETRRFFNWATVEGHFESNPFDGLKNVRIPTKIVKPFSTEDIQKMVASLKQNLDRNIRDELVLMLLLDTGIRRGELVGIDLEDVDTAARRIRIRNAKGGNQRVVPYASQCAEKMRLYLLIRGTTPGRLLWSVHSTGHMRIGAPITASGIRLLLARLGRLSGVDKVHAHRFRHTFATWAINSDARELDVQHLLGHKSLEMVRRYSASYQSEQAANRHSAFSPGDQMLDRFLQRS